MRLNGGLTMAKDVVFKTKAFGGFDKQEVMDFINGILAEKSELERKLESVSERCALLEAEISDCKIEIEEMGALRSEVAAATSLSAELQSQIDCKETEISNLLSLIAEKDAKIAELEESSQENDISEEVKTELDFLRAEVQRLKAECEKKKDLERQVGAAMLDARVHSEELVEAAKERANLVTKSVYAAIGETALKIDDLSAGIGEIARSFTRSVEEVELRIKALTGDMSKTAQLLISETGMIADSSSDDSTTAVEYDFSKDTKKNDEQ